jgi:hypothetical protein
MIGFCSVWHDPLKILTLGVGLYIYVPPKILTIESVLPSNRVKCQCISAKGLPIKSYLQKNVIICDISVY